MAMAELVWEDQPGTWRGSFAKLEDTSRSGACIRVTTAISVGARLKVKWHKEQFSGIAKYCRREGGEYILGIQREPSEDQVRTLDIANKAMAKPTTVTKAAATAIAKLQEEPARLESQEIIKEAKTVPQPEPARVQGVPVTLPLALPAPAPIAIPAAATPVPVIVPVPAPIMPIPIAKPAPTPAPLKPFTIPVPPPLTPVPQTMPVRPVAAPPAVQQAVAQVISQPVADVVLPRSQHSNPDSNPDSNIQRPNELLAQGPVRGPERTSVFSRLLHLGGSGKNHQNVPDGNSNNSKGKTNVMDPKPSHTTPAVTNARAPAPALPPARTATPAIHQGRLLPLEDIYLAVGIMSSRLGYNIDTVSAMLESEHLRGMSSEVKRASVMMALEAAGIPVDELLQDGAQRLDALNEYEAGERRHFEEYEARKAQENAQIQAEIERMTAHCVGRVQNNLGEVASAKEAFEGWQEKKLKETQRISDAVSLFGKTSLSPPDRVKESQHALEEVGAESKR
jgi:hypothetical protein